MKKMLCALLLALAFPVFGFSIIQTAAPLTRSLKPTPDIQSTQYSDKKAYFDDHDLPNSRFTPGAVDDALTKEIICNPEFLRTASRVVSRGLQARVYKSYGTTSTTDFCASGKGCEIDHLIPISLGGASGDIRNLWPQATTSDWNYSKKNDLETKMHDLVCFNNLDLKKAQEEIAANWIQAYIKYMEKK